MLVSMRVPGLPVAGLGRPATETGAAGWWVVIVLAAVVGTALGLGLLWSGALLVLWVLWELVSAPFRGAR